MPFFRFISLVLAIALIPILTQAQSVPVTFSYYNSTVSSAQVRGESAALGNWGQNPISMTEISDGHFVATVNLNVNGGSFSQNGSAGYNYKFWYPSDNWVSDPLNPIQNASDNNNSVVFVSSPMVFQPSIAEGALLTVDNPFSFSATLTSATTDPLDLTQSQILLNDVAVSNWEEFYDLEKALLVIPGDTLKSRYLVGGNNQIKINLQTQSGASTEQVVDFTFLQEVAVNEIPVPNGWKQGVNVLADDSVGIVLFAPKKNFVHIIGDFTDWAVDDRYLMNKHQISEDSVYWWVGFKGLLPYREYGFQYLIDGTLRVADPFSQLLLVPGDDQFIDDSVYPNMPAYPTGKTEYQVGVFSTSSTWLDYDWEVEEFERPAPEELVIYEMLVRDWVASHRYQDVIDSLDYLTRLGVNALQLMPVMEFEGNESWGYNPVSHFAVDKYYGSPQKLKELIDECHKRGIAVILDIVYNHMYGQAPLVRLYNQGAFGRPTADHPYFNVNDPNPVFSFGYDMNHESAVTKAYIDSASAFWLEKYKVDGFRFDFTKGMTNTPGDGGAYDAARIRILKRMYDELQKRDSTAYYILEHFASTSEEQELNRIGFMSWAGGTKTASQEAAMGYHDGSKSNLNDFYYGNRNLTNPYWVGYMESHDEERLMYKMENNGASEGSYDVKEQGTALERLKAMGAVTFLIPGPKMIWQFGELGYDYSIDFNGRVGNKPIRWDYQRDEERLKVYKAWSEIIRLRKSSDIFSSGDTQVSLNLGPALKTFWLQKDGEYAYIAANLDTETREASLLMPKDTVYNDFWTGQQIQTEMINGDPRYRITMEPGSFKIFTTASFTKPEEGGLVVAIDENEELPSETTLGQNFPNPFNPTTTIRYFLSGLSQVEIEVFDMNGRKVATLVSKVQNRGWHQVAFNASNVPSGVYVYRLKSDFGVYSQKMTLIK